jgi:hypothetical protein
LRTGLISTLFIDQKMAERILAGLQAAAPLKTSTRAARPQTME